MSILIRTELQKFITGLGKSGQLSIRKAGSEALFFFVLRYLLCAAGEIRQALSIGDIGPAFGNAGMRTGASPTPPFFLRFKY